MHVFNQADQSGNWLLAAALRQPSCCLAIFNLLAYVNPYNPNPIPNPNLN